MLNPFHGHSRNDMILHSFFLIPAFSSSCGWHTVKRRMQEQKKVRGHKNEFLKHSKKICSLVCHLFAIIPNKFFSSHLLFHFYIYLYAHTKAIYSCVFFSLFLKTLTSSWYRKPFTTDTWTAHTHEYIYSSYTITSSIECELYCVFVCNQSRFIAFVMEEPAFFFLFGVCARVSAVNAQKFAISAELYGAIKAYLSNIHILNLLYMCGDHKIKTNDSQYICAFMLEQRKVKFIWYRKNVARVFSLCYTFGHNSAEYVLNSVMKTHITNQVFANYFDASICFFSLKKIERRSRKTRNEARNMLICYTVRQTHLRLDKLDGILKKIATAHIHTYISEKQWQWRCARRRKTQHHTTIACLKWEMARHAAHHFGSPKGKQMKTQKSDIATKDRRASEEKLSY